MPSTKVVHIPQQAHEYFLPKLEGFQYLTERTVDVPRPQPGQVLVKIHAVSLNVRLFVPFRRSGIC